MSEEQKQTIEQKEVKQRPMTLLQKRKQNILSSSQSRIDLIQGKTTEIKENPTPIEEPTKEEQIENKVESEQTQKLTKMINDSSLVSTMSIISLLSFLFFIGLVGGHIMDYKLFSSDFINGFLSCFFLILSLLLILLKKLLLILPKIMGSFPKSQ